MAGAVSVLKTSAPAPESVRLCRLNGNRHPASTAADRSRASGQRGHPQIAQSLAIRTDRRIADRSRCGLVTAAMLAGTRFMANTISSFTARLDNEIPQRYFLPARRGTVAGGRPNRICDGADLRGRTRRGPDQFHQRCASICFCISFSTGERCGRATPPFVAKTRPSDRMACTGTSPFNLCLGSARPAVSAGRLACRSRI